MCIGGRAAGALQLGHVNDGGILPDGTLILAESVASDKFLLCCRLNDGARLEFGVHGARK